jgi:hypothetical protein
MIEMESTPELPTPGSIKIGDLDITEVGQIPEEAKDHIKLTEAEIPHTSDAIYLGTGHTIHLPIEIVEPSDLYFIKSTPKYGGEFYNIHANIRPKNLANNKFFQENPVVTTPNTLIPELGETIPAQELVFNLIHQEFMQGNLEQTMKILKMSLEDKKEYVSKNYQKLASVMQKNIDSAINLINTRFEVEYQQALAVDKLLKLTEGLNLEWRNNVKEIVDHLLRPDNSEKVIPKDERFEQIQQEIQEALAAY